MLATVRGAAECGDEEINSTAVLLPASSGGEGQSRTQMRSLTRLGCSKVDARFAEGGYRDK